MGFKKLKLKLILKIKKLHKINLRRITKKRQILDKILKKKRKTNYLIRNKYKIK